MDSFEWVDYLLLGLMLVVVLWAASGLLPTEAFLWF
jgi:hypothetical protein